jgi:riboflavin kinase / FMN adenylyltransferase
MSALTFYGQQPTAGSVVTFGVFDGVHRGHQHLLTQARVIADQQKLPLIVMTFHPHPLAIVRGASPLLLTCIDRRVELLLKHGADGVAVMTFDDSAAAIDASNFMEDVLARQLQAKHVLVSRFARFGHKAVGDFPLLQSRTDLFQTYGASVLKDETATISSTRIRGLVTAGDLTQANELLGRPHGVEGLVVHGDARGRQLGYPTANLGLKDPVAIPADGVYAGWLSVEGERWPAAISVGTNPTFDGHDRRVEAYALDRDDLELYDRQALVEFAYFLRPTLKFDGVEPLLVQMKADCDQARMLITA